MKELLPGERPTPAEANDGALVVPAKTIVRMVHRSETEERMAADRRRRRIRSEGARAEPAPVGREDLQLVNMAIAGLCEAVRDYAIFVMNADGVIVYWGMGAHLMKWWTPEEAEGGHLRMLYPENGGEDGTAEAHLFEAATTGEYVGEGQRVRRGGSTFWAHVVLTALRSRDGTLLGFAKVTQDLTKRRAIEAAVALANEAQSSSEAAAATAEEAQLARERAEEARLRAEAARERAEEAAAAARAQVRSAEEQIVQLRRESIAAQQSKDSVPSMAPDPYIDLFMRGDDSQDRGAP